MTTKPRIYHSDQLGSVTIPEPYETRQVGDLQDGDEFSLDSGNTWYTCAVVLWGTVSVYISNRRDEDAPCVRIEADRDQDCLVRA